MKNRRPASGDTTVRVCVSISSTLNGQLERASIEAGMTKSYLVSSIVAKHFVALKVAK
jgi:hypothetical protein